MVLAAAACDGRDRGVRDGAAEAIVTAGVAAAANAILTAGAATAAIMTAGTAAAGTEPGTAEMLRETGTTDSEPCCPRGPLYTEQKG